MEDQHKVYVVVGGDQSGVLEVFSVWSRREDAEAEAARMQAEEEWQSNRYSVWEALWNRPWFE